MRRFAAHRTARLLASASLFAAGPALASTFQVLHNFTGPSQSGGAGPEALALNNGTLYGGTGGHEPGGSVLYTSNATTGQSNILQVLQSSGGTPFGYGLVSLINFGNYEFGIEPQGGTRETGSIISPTARMAARPQGHGPIAAAVFTAPHQAAVPMVTARSTASRSTASLSPPPTPSRTPSMAHNPSAASPV
jgi:hypothetical protein